MPKRHHHKKHHAKHESGHLANHHSGYDDSGYGNRSNGHDGQPAGKMVKFEASAQCGLPRQSFMSNVGEPAHHAHTSEFTHTFANINKQMNGDMSDIKKNKERMSF
jgi:hypothetical protein